MGSECQVFWLFCLFVFDLMLIVQVYSSGSTASFERQTSKLKKTTHNLYGFAISVHDEYICHVGVKHQTLLSTVVEHHMLCLKV